MTSLFYERMNMHLSELELSFPKYPSFSSWTVRIHCFNIDLSCFNKSETNRKIVIQNFHLIMNYFPIYTDTSKIEKGTVAAFYMKDHNASYKFLCTYFNYFRELFAILKAIEIFRCQIIRKTVVITDSHKYSCLLHLKIELRHLCQINTSKQFIWVSYHKWCVVISNKLQRKWFWINSSGITPIINYQSTHNMKTTDHHHQDKDRSYRPVFSG